MTLRVRTWMATLALAVSLLPGCMHMSSWFVSGPDGVENRDGGATESGSLIKRPLREPTSLVAITSGQGLNLERDPDLKLPRVEKDVDAGFMLPEGHETEESSAPVRDPLAIVGKSLPQDSVLANVTSGLITDPKVQINYKLTDPESIFPKRNMDVALPVQSPPPLPVLGPTGAKKEPLLVAMELFLRNQPHEALDYLRDYPQANQDVFLRLLPVLKTMTQRRLQDLSPDEQRVLYQTLEGLMATMRGQTELMIDQMYYFEEDSDAGEYRALADDHEFKAGSGSQSGDLVQVYVQVRNMTCEKRHGYYETKVSSTVRIRDAQGAECVLRNFSGRDGSGRDGCLRDKTIRPDQSLIYNFYVSKKMPPGNYTLSVEVRDETGSGPPRIAIKELPFRVRP